MATYTLYHAKDWQSIQDANLWPYNKPVLIEVKRFNQPWRVAKWQRTHPAADVWVRVCDKGNTLWFHLTPEYNDPDPEPVVEYQPHTVAATFEILDLNPITCEGERI